MSPAEWDEARRRAWLADDRRAMNALDAAWDRAAARVERTRGTQQLTAKEKEQAIAALIDRSVLNVLSTPVTGALEEET